MSICLQTPAVIIVGRGRALAATARELASVHPGPIHLLGTSRGAAFSAASELGSRAAVVQSLGELPRAGLAIFPGSADAEADDAERHLLREWPARLEARFVFSGPRSNRRAAAFAQAGGGQPSRVIATGGVAGQLARRIRLARAAGADLSQVSVLVAGDQDPDLITLSRFVTIAGIPVSEIFTDSWRLARVLEADFPGDSVLVAHEARAAAMVAGAILMDRKQILCCGVHTEGDHGLPRGRMTVPAVIGAEGTERLMVSFMSTEERSAVLRLATGNR